MRWLRSLGPRLVLGMSVLLALIATHMTVSKARLPFVVMNALDQAFTALPAPPDVERLPTDARVAYAQHMVDRLDHVMDRIDGELLVAIDRATLALDAQLARIAQVTPDQRAAAIGLTLNHLVDARTHLAHTDDPVEYAEYDALCERLREVRRQLAGWQRA